MSCQYGKQCYRTGNLDHCSKFKHPCNYGNPCYKTSNCHNSHENHHTVNTPVYQSHERRCKYGNSCFRTNPSHFTEFSHPWCDHHWISNQEYGRSRCSKCYIFY